MWIHRNHILIYISEDFGFNPNVAGCGFMHTIVKDYYKADEWRIADPSYMEKFKAIHDNGGSIVFFSNQSKILNINNIKSRFDKFAKDFVVDYAADDSQDIPDEERKKQRIPIMALFSLRHNCFRKPFNNMWKVMGFVYIKQGKQPPDLSKSIYIGKMDGSFYVKNWDECKRDRYARKIYRNRSDVDRAFAANIGVPFVSHKLFFHGEDTKWQWSRLIMPPDERLKYQRKQKKVVEPNMIEELMTLPSPHNKYFIMVMGRPSSGKSTLIKRLEDDLMEKFGENFKYNIMKTDDDGKKKTMSKNGKYTKNFIQKIKDALFDSTVILHMKFSNYNSRNELIEIARLYEIPTFIIYLTTPEKICRVMNFVKIQISKNFDQEYYLTSPFNEWQKKFEYPDYYEKDVKMIEYPMVLRFRQELKFRYSPF